jgi:hypothetical protein
MIPIPFSTGKTILSWFIATFGPSDILTKANSYCAIPLATAFHESNLQTSDIPSNTVM